MKVLYLKEKKERKPDLVGCAVMEAFSQIDDIVHTATIEIGGLHKTLTSIKALVRQYNPEIIIAQKVLGSVVLFELPKTLKKIIINPYLILENSDDAIKIPFILKYNNLRLYKWLIRVSKDFSLNQGNTFDDRTYLLALQTKDYADPIEKISCCHKAINKVRVYFDPNYEMPDIDELLKH